MQRARAASPPRRRPIATSCSTSGLDERISRRAGRRSTSKTSTKLAERRRADPRSGFSPRRSRRGSSKQSLEELRAHERRPATSPSRCAPRRPRKICPKPRSPASRKRSSTCAARADVLKAMHEVFASLFNDRAIAYRVHQGFDHNAVALSAGVQHMVRSDLGSSGVMFTLDTDSGFRDVVFITASYGLGETVVQGAVNPDEFYVYKPALRAGQAADPAPQPRRQGHQDGLRARRARGERVATVDVPQADRAALLAHRRRHRRAREAGAHHRGALRLPDGHRVGQGRRDRRDLHPAGAAGNRAEPRRPHDPALLAQEPLEGAGHRPQHRPAHRRRSRARHSRREGDGARAERRRARRRHDGSRTGSR